MANLKELLKEKHMGLSPLMADREKMESEEASSYDSLTMSKVHLVSLSDKDDKVSLFAVVTFKEAPDKFYFGGLVLTEIVEDIYKMLGENPTEVLDVEDEGIVLTVTRRRSNKSRREYYDWKIV